VTVTRSEVLAEGIIASNAFTQLYTPPTGFIAIVKTIWTACIQATAATYGVILAPAGTSNHMYIDSVPTPQLNVGTGMQTWIVLGPGDALSLAAGNCPVLYHVSGAVLPTTTT
jgi:hypothetical protein